MPSRIRRKRYEAKAKREEGQFLALPRACLDHPSYVELGPYARALLVEMLRQYNGDNNGDLSAAWGLLKLRGVASSRTTLDRARDDLERRGWIVQTRQGGRNHPNLYALTFLDVDHCGGKLDAGIPVGQRLSYWRTGSNPRLSARLLE